MATTVKFKTAQLVLFDSKRLFLDCFIWGFLFQKQLFRNVAYPKQFLMGSLFLGAHNWHRPPTHLSSQKQYSQGHIQNGLF